MELFALIGSEEGSGSSPVGPPTHRNPNWKQFIRRFNWAYRENKGCTFIFSVSPIKPQLCSSPTNTSLYKYCWSHSFYWSHFKNMLWHWFKAQERHTKLVYDWCYDTWDDKKKTHTALLAFLKTISLMVIVLTRRWFIRFFYWQRPCDNNGPYQPFLPFSPLRSSSVY